MNRRSRGLVGVLAVAANSLALLTACGSPPPMGSTATPTLPQGNQEVELDPAEFTTDIDNPYWPMTKGTQWTYRETDGSGAELSVVVTVTSELKKIANGITARVVRDTVRRDGEIIEDTFDWYAQDVHGTIWYLGEETAEFDNGVVTSTGGSFEAGVDGALAGVVVPADPQRGMKYRQEYYKDEAEDNGEILSTDEMAEVPFGQFDRVLLTKDTITIEPGVLQYKLYAPGVGPVLVLDVSGGSGREELVSMKTVPDGTATGPLGQPD